MRIIKIFNNNSVAAISPELGDIILTGSGIGFQKKVGDVVDSQKIEKTYLFKEDPHKRLEREDNISPDCYEITNQIVSRAIKKLRSRYYGEIFLTMTDHISFALKRKVENIKLPYVVLGDVSVLYKDEYEIGLWALSYIKKKTGITLDIEEANYIALHLVNFSMDNNTHNATKIMSFVTDIIGIIENSMKITLSPQSLSYARLSTHLKYLAERIFTGQEINLKDTTEDIRELLKENLRLSMCINRIVKHIKDKYKLLVGERTAEDIKITIGTVFPGSRDEKMEVRGRDLVTGLPHTITLTSDEVEEALRESVYTIIHAVKGILEQTPPELSADIIDKGIVLTGGGALVDGFAQILSQELKVPVFIAESPLTCVAEGTGILLDNLYMLERQ